MEEAEETTKGGIILTGSAKEKPSVAEVISVGPGGTVDGKTVTMTVKPGDKVITDKYAGTKVTLEDEEYIIVKQGRHSGDRRLSFQRGDCVPLFDSPVPVCALVTPPKAVGQRYFCDAHVVTKMKFQFAFIWR